LETDAMIMGRIMAHLRDAAGEAFIEASPEQPLAENTAIRLVRFSRRAAKPMATAGYDPAPTA
jgi:hypothetical protein